MTTYTDYEVHQKSASVLEKIGIEGEETLKDLKTRGRIGQEKN